MGGHGRDGPFFARQRRDGAEDSGKGGKKVGREGWMGNGSEWEGGREGGREGVSKW